MDNFWEENFSCPACGSKQLVLATGNRQSKILIVGEYPGEEELKQGIPMVGPMGRVLRQELAYLNFDLKSARRTNLWRHPPHTISTFSKDIMKTVKTIDGMIGQDATWKQLNSACLRDGMEEVIKEAKNKQAILLLGDEVVRTFVGRAVTKIAGLNVKSNYFSALVIVCCPNPAIVFHQGKGIGEMRLALQKFMKLVEELKDDLGIDKLRNGSSGDNNSDPWI